MDDREEGEISDEEVSLVYKPMERPNAHTSYRDSALISDYEESDSDDDSFLPKRRRVSVEPPPQPTVTLDGKVKKPRKPNKIWSNILQEESLMETISGVGLSRKIRNNRSVESYEYPGARHESSEDEGEPRQKVWHRLSKKERPAPKKVDKSPRHLVDADVTEEASDSDVGCVIADCLFEKKASLIVRVVEILGRETTLALYRKTQEVEAEGGMLILDGTRRRTSGGVFLALLKKFPGVSKEQVSKIFENDVREQVTRKRKRNHDRHIKDQELPIDNLVSMSPKDRDDHCLHLNTLFSDDPGGTKCPGSTPVTSPQGSDSESSIMVKQPAPVLLDEVCVKVARKIEERNQKIKSIAGPEAMDIV